MSQSKTSWKKLPVIVSARKILPHNFRKNVMKEEVYTVLVHRLATGFWDCSLTETTKRNLRNHVKTMALDDDA